MPTVNQSDPLDVGIGDRIEDMIHDLRQEGFQEARAPYYDKLQCDSNKTLYLGCTTFTQLSPVLALVNLKVE